MHFEASYTTLLLHALLDNLYNADKYEKLVFSWTGIIFNKPYYKMEVKEWLCVTMLIKFGIKYTSYVCNPLVYIYRTTNLSYMHWLAHLKAFNLYGTYF